MATVYKIKIEVVSPFVSYTEGDIAYRFEKFLKEYKDPKTNLGFEGIEIDVERL